jgi:hypothetical protein
MRSLALFKCRSRASDYGRGMTQSLPLSYWPPEKSYMTSSPTAMKIYIAARFRVKEYIFQSIYETSSCPRLCTWAQSARRPFFNSRRPNSLDFIHVVIHNVGAQTLYFITHDFAIASNVLCRTFLCTFHFCKFE